MTDAKLRLFDLFEDSLSFVGVSPGCNPSRRAGRIAQRRQAVYPLKRLQTDMAGMMPTG